MGSAYTPGLLVTKCTTIEKVRELPLPGKCLVQVGAQVQASTPVLAAELPGEIDIVRVADRLGLDPQDVVAGMKVKTGDAIEANALICEIKTFFGLFTNRVQSPASGTIEYFTAGNAHLGIRRPPTPLAVNAYVAGVVKAVEPGKSVTIEGVGALIQGIFGVGGENHGDIFALPVSPDSEVTAADLKKPQTSLQNKVLIGGACFTREALAVAATAGVAAVVTGSVDSETLLHFVGSEIGISVTGDEAVPFTFIVTEGFGRLALSERICVLAKELHGKAASVNGATQVRAGAMRPEVIVSGDTADTRQGITPQQMLQVGSRIRAIRVPYFGELGTVTELPAEPTIIPTGAKVRILHARLDRGEIVVIPRANVELV